MDNTTTAVKAIMEFFGTGESARKVTMTEMKALSKPERDELGQLCANALGKTLVLVPDSSQS